ncbi:MAG: endonuclease MutS2 [Pyrinomonadaceae bacterium]|nr:endonuclease MutS2 [Pyrinomonadaceae bacterium]
MNNTTLTALEYDRLRQLIARYAQTPMGKSYLENLEPLKNRLQLQNDLQTISETILLNEEKQVTWNFSGLIEPSDAIAILKIKNATLEPTVLLEVTRICNQALFARSVIAPEKDFVPNLWKIVENLPPQLFQAISSITKKLLPSGEIDDSASPELARIRRELNLHRGRLQKSLEGIMRSNSDAIQDAIVTQRNERFVIPVKADFRGKINGVAHGFSSSGATMFIEPLEAIDANNELAALKAKEEAEIARILFSLTEELRQQLPNIENAVIAVAELDFIKAKVEFARRFNAVVPKISDDETLDLVDARHPLLEENLKKISPQINTDEHRLENDQKSKIKNQKSDEIVPNSFKLTKNQSVMIISGANAGGKTVVMKTAGLLSLMAISGLPVPAREATIPFYASVLADIGDHQSLSANLSTFSSHISNIAEMLKIAQAPALVLLDEVGTGTDPDEGSALGVAIVDTFRKLGAQVIASTHYKGLKIYAANDENVINASVEFNEKTLQPTYRLLTGFAGASSGIEIARRFGIPIQVIEQARVNLDRQAKETEQFLLKLRRETATAEDLRIALEEEREATAMKYAKLDIEAGKREKERQKEFAAKMTETLESFDKQVKVFLQTVEDKALKAKFEKETAARKAELKRFVVEKSQVSSPKSQVFSENKTESNVQVEDVPIAVGLKVLTSFGNVGIVEKIDGETAEVLVGSMRLREKLKNLQAVVSDETQKTSKLEKLQKQATSNLRLDVEETNAELNLIGKRTDEAEYLLDRFLDESYMNGLQRVRVIHGFGTGALKNFVHHFLKNHAHVLRYTFAEPNQGGQGATIAELKQ